MKELFELLESSEEGKALLGAVKEKFSSVNSVEAELRTVKSQLEQYSELNIAELQAKAQYVDEKGGMEAIDSSVAKANGVEDLKAQAEADRKAREALEAEWQGKWEKQTQELQRKTLETEVMPYFAKDFKEGLSGVLLKHAIDNNLIVRGEDGLFTDIDGTRKPFSQGYEDLKQLDSFKGGLSTPSGGDVGGGANGGNTGNSGGSNVPYWKKQ